jgi:5-methyltetrahydrofolate--homocysteine methyltransferase
VPVVQNLISDIHRPELIAKINGEYDTLRTQHANRQSDRDLLPYHDAVKNGFDGDWDQYTPPAPLKPGITVLRDLPLETLVPYIDWTPFFSTWELRGKYPAILKDSVVGEEATRLFADAQKMLRQLISDRSIHAHGVAGIFPARRMGADDICVFTDETRTEEDWILHALRQQGRKADGLPNFSLADFIAPTGDDWIGGFAVTAGDGVEALAARYEKELDDYSSIMVKALADRFAEAFAEYLHERVRKEIWGYAADETASSDDLIAELYKGIRPAPGYPACPDHTEKETLFEMLNATEHTGIRLTESFAMMPAAAVSGWYFSHPRSRYFGLGKIGLDQVEDYARRKNMLPSEVERWLSPHLSYEPAPARV